MARRPRWFESGIPVHLVQRGNDRMPCFRATEDYRTYLDWLGTFSARLHIRVHAYVLMTNHVHMLVTATDKGGTSRFMQTLGRNYVWYFNKKHGRTGTLWEGRFKSHPVQSDSHFLCVHRYIELNPVRAGIVARPDDYRWSSYHRNALGRPDALVSEHPLYTEMGSTGAERQEAYRSLFGRPFADDTVRAIRAAASTGLPFGDAVFCDALSRHLRLPLRGKNGRPCKANEPRSTQLNPLRENCL